MAYTIDIGLGRTVFEVDRDFDLAFEIFSKIVEIGHEVMKMPKMNKDMRPLQ